MIIRDLLSDAVNRLVSCGVENARNEARWIFEAAFDCGREYVVLHGNDEADGKKAERFAAMINNRAGGMPVQYVIGEWDFYGESYRVGEASCTLGATTSVINGVISANISSGLLS